MPRQNGTGPWGMGPGTGRGMGPCGSGMGFRKSSSCGFSRFWRFGPQVSPKDERQTLEQEARILEEELKAIKNRLSELK